MGDGVGVEAGDAVPQQTIEDVALPGRDAAGQTHLQHRHWGLGIADCGLTIRGAERVIPITNQSAFCNLPLCHTQFSSADGVLQQHRDGQRTDSARHGRQRSGDLGYLRMDVTDDQGASPFERLAPLRSCGEESLDDRAVSHLSCPDVHDRRARPDEVARHEGGTCRSPRQGYPPGAPTCGRSAVFEWQIVTVRMTVQQQRAPSACPRCRCGR